MDPIYVILILAPAFVGVYLALVVHRHGARFVRKTQVLPQHYSLSHH